MKRLPKKLAIAGATWKVKRAHAGKVRALALQRCSKCKRPIWCDKGCTDPNTKTIWIALGISRRAAWVTLLHEILHALEYETIGDHAQGDAVRERFIESIDDPLFSLLHDLLGLGAE